MKIIDPDTAGQRETIEYCLLLFFLKEIPEYRLLFFIHCYSHRFKKLINLTYFYYFTFADYEFNQVNTHTCK